MALPLVCTGGLPRGAAHQPADAPVPAGAQDRGAAHARSAREGSFMAEQNLQRKTI